MFSRYKSIKEYIRIPVVEDRGRRPAIFLLMLIVASMAFAQTRREIVRERVDSLLRTRYEQVTYDTLYLARPQAKLTLKLRGNLSHNSIHARYEKDGEKFRSNLNTDARVTFSMGVNYMGLAVGAAINPAHLSGKNKDIELNLNAYYNRFGVEAYYQLSKTLSGSMGDTHLEKGSLRLASFYLTGYYAFNYRRFSYPAALMQSYIQKRSAGSWLVSFAYQGGSIKATDEAPDELDGARLYVGNFAVGGGYGYNLVAKKWLFHLSIQPNIIIFNNNSLKVNGEKNTASYHFPEMMFNTRAAIIYNMNKKWFFGSTFVMNSTIFGDYNEYTEQWRWRARAFVGMRL